MATCNLTALEQAACSNGFDCLAPGRRQVIRLQLLCEILAGGGGGGGYLSYVALLSQADVNAPTAVVLENTLGVTITFGYIGPGDYTLNASSPVFLAAKTFLLIGNVNDGDVLNTHPAWIGRITNSQLTIGTFETSHTPSDALLNSTSIEIRVYP